MRTRRDGRPGAAHALARRRPWAPARATSTRRSTATVAGYGRLDGADPPATRRRPRLGGQGRRRLLAPHLPGGLRRRLRADRRLHPYGPDTEMPPCGQPPPAYADIAENAFYCPSNDLIAWDEAVPHPLGQRELRGVHDRHRVRPRVRPRHPGAGGDERPHDDLEMQADCFAGAWTATSSTATPEFSIDEAELDAAWPASSPSATSVGTGRRPLAHGSGFDRIGSFLDGYETAPAPARRTRPHAPGDTVEVPFDEHRGRTERQPAARGPTGAAHRDRARTSTPSTTSSSASWAGRWRRSTTCGWSTPEATR